MDAALTFFVDTSDARDLKAIKTMLALARNRAAQRDRRTGAFFICAGQHLARLRRGRSKAEWAALVRTEAGLGVRRAYELVRLAAGTPVADVRAETAARVRRTRAAKRATRSARARNAPRSANSDDISSG